MAKRTAKFTITIEVPFEEYNTEAENRNAVKHIHGWLKDTLMFDLSYIELPDLGKDEDGFTIDGSSYKTKFKIVRG